ncbi:hypothetical protein L0B52_09020 [Suttonella sp. R2A3]|uniref:hypothetical protein n=1 Tax=Suttonella sp. R2A3 TaxID=2908648 RepID=UPI001F3D1D23|nr:hypothetical protein [Suttonella sp. R2A3]UJF24455.1 hypothetical protein L0B52_09020 [Suttonella sp. R2A3]
MEDKIYEIIKSWAGIPTWHTTHPLDQERFSIAMHNLVSDLGANVDIEAFQNALRRHAESHVDILGAPDHWDELILKFTIKVETIFTYELAR